MRECDDLPPRSYSQDGKIVLGVKSAKMAPAPYVDIGQCPEPSSPEAARAIHEAAYRRLWEVIGGPDTTPQDVISAYAATRLAARQGVDRPAVKRPRLKMRSMLPPEPTPPAIPPAIVKPEG